MASDLKATKRARQEDVDDDDSDSGDELQCAVCFEAVSNAGAHRSVTLKCGHLFGESCAIKALQFARSKEQRVCPLCRQPAAEKDIRPVLNLGTKRRVVDTTTLEGLRRTKVGQSRDLIRAQTEIESLKAMVAELKSRLANVEGAKAAATECPKCGHGASACAVGACPAVTSRPTVAVREAAAGKARSTVLKKLWCASVVGASARCAKVIAADGSIAVGHCRTGPTARGVPTHGVTKVDLEDPRFQTALATSHSKPVRGIEHSLETDILLSVSQDGRGCLANLTTGNVAGVVELHSPAWCCAWDQRTPYEFHLGALQRVVTYDTRRLAGPIRSLELPEKRPIVSLSCHKVGSSAAKGGRARMVACTPISAWALEESGTWTKLPSATEGMILGCNACPATEHLLVTSYKDRTNLGLYNFQTSAESACADPVVWSTTSMRPPTRAVICSWPGCTDPVVAQYVHNTHSIATWQHGPQGGIAFLGSAQCGSKAPPVGLDSAFDLSFDYSDEGASGIRGVLSLVAGSRNTSDSGKSGDIHAFNVVST